MSKFQNDAIFWVDVDKIDPNPYQPRRDFNEESLRDLAESIRQYGVLQPLTVTRNEETKDDGGLKVYYELIAGERRLRAAKMANLSQVPVTIRDQKEDSEVKLELAIIENLQREDLNPIERAEAFDQLAEQFEFTHKEIAEKIGKSREYVSNSMRLLKLPEKVKKAVIAGKITEGHTRPIMMLRDKPEKQEQLFKEIIRQDLTVREAEDRARRDAQDKVRKKENKVDPETKALEEELSDTLGTRVKIEKKDDGDAGKVVIDFFSEEDLEAILELMKENEEADMEDMMEEYMDSIEDEESDDEEVQASKDEAESTDTDTEHEDAANESRDTAEPEKPDERSETDQVPDGNKQELDAIKGKSGSMAQTLGTMIQEAREKQQRDSGADTEGETNMNEKTEEDGGAGQRDESAGQDNNNSAVKKGRSESGQDQPNNSVEKLQESLRPSEQPKDTSGQEVSSLKSDEESQSDLPEKASEESSEQPDDTEPNDDSDPLANQTNSLGTDGEEDSSSQDYQSKSEDDSSDESDLDTGEKAGKTDKSENNQSDEEDMYSVSNFSI